VVRRRETVKNGRETPQRVPVRSMHLPRESLKCGAIRFPLQQNQGLWERQENPTRPVHMTGATVGRGTNRGEAENRISPANRLFGGSVP
jgi:hypothetical protein